MGKKSRTKRLVREGQIPPNERVHSQRRGKQNRANLWSVLGVVAIVVVGVGFIAKSALTSTPVASPGTGTVPSMNDTSGQTGITVGKRVAMANMAVPASTGRNLTLSQYRGRKLVVYFYEGIT